MSKHHEKASNIKTADLSLLEILKQVNDVHTPMLTQLMCVEFMKKYTKKIICANMSWYEKLDIFLFTYNLPLTALFSLYIVINIVILPLLGYNLHYPGWLLIPTIVFFFAPMVNDFISWFTKIKKTELLRYMFLTFMLYGSMLYQSIKASFFALIGRKAVFIVTPKTTSRMSVMSAIKANREEIVFAIVVGVVALLFKDSILPVILIVIPALSSVYLTLFSNVDDKKVDVVDVERVKFRKTRERIPRTSEVNSA